MTDFSWQVRILELINNISKTLKDDLSEEIKKGSKLSIVAACFSIYAFQELKRELKNIDELRFIFTSPTFTTEKAKKEKREFYIPRLNRERSLYGTEFEVKLRNELTQKAIARECAEWIRKKVTFKSNVTNGNIPGFMTLDDKCYAPISGFTTVDLGCERGNDVYNYVYKMCLNLDERIELIEKRKKLEKEIARLEKLARSKRQPKKKLEILKRIKELEIIHNA